MANFRWFFFHVIQVAMADSQTHHLASYNIAAPVTYHRGGALALTGLSLVHDGGRILFQPADISLRHGTITGLVGTNGCGKTSLARILSSKDLPEFPKGLVIEYLAASDDEEYLAGHFTEEDSLSLRPIEYINLRIQQRSEQLLDQINELETKLESIDEFDGEEVDLEQISDQLAQLYDLQDDLSEKIQREMHHALDELGLRKYENKQLSELSSGWRYKCRLVAAFLTHPDLLIIDEPSFLDESSTQWLVSRSKEASNKDNAIILLISHKEILLDTLCDNILYINSGNQTLTTYHCGYSVFRSTHEDQVGAASKVVAGTEKKQQNAEKSLKKIQAELKGRERNLKSTTSQNADQRFIKGKNKEAKQKADRSAAAKAKMMKKKVADLEETRRQARTERVKPLHIDGVPVEGKVVSLQDVAASYGGNEELIFENVDCCMEATDCVLLTGSNGVGKSSLVKVILGEMEPAQGQVSQKGSVIYFPQTALSNLLRQHGNESARNFLGDALTETEARIHLGNFGLARDLALRPINTLSAGQRVRLWLAKNQLLHPKPALLVVDEISENVDKETRDSLIDLISSFEAAVLIISHDPDFCHRLKPTKIWELRRYGLRETYFDN